MTLQISTRPMSPARIVLPGVPRVGFYQGGERCPEDVPFPACLRACLDYFGESLGYRLIPARNTIWRLDNTFTFLMGVTGYAFRLSWRADWPGDPLNRLFLFDDPAAPCIQTFEAVGYAVDRVALEGRGTNEPIYRDAILRSLRDRGCPVIAFGVIGPPEPCLITGYDENGDVLIGWNFFQDFPEYNSGVSFEAAGEFRKRDWFANTRSLLIFGEKQKPPPSAELFHKVLGQALQAMRAPIPQGDLQHPDGCSGMAAYQAWASALLRDADFAGDQNSLRERFQEHDDAVSTVAEGRWYAARFMEYIAASEPALEEDLVAAAECFEYEHDLMWQIWELVGGSGRSDQHVRKLADPLIRRRIVALILQAMEEERQAADRIEQALQNKTAEPVNTAGQVPLCFTLR